jgi:biofilm PGA synthesis N-glycosyltransferase PgaC
VLGLFRRDAVLGVGGYRSEMATEDIDLSWRLLLAGWHTSYEPRALVGMHVPTSLPALWAQRKRWARGQGEVLHVHQREVVRWRNRRLWPLALESVASLAWIVALVVAQAVIIAAVVIWSAGVPDLPALTLLLGWGIAVAVAATVQTAIALQLDLPYDRLAALAFLLGPLYPVGHWMVSAAAALRAEIVAFVRGPAEARVVWDIPRDA